ncbi:MAG: cobaltochelatase subunit CobN, partial [bacterium]
MKKIVAVVWHSYTTQMRKAGEALTDCLDITVYSDRFLKEGKEDFDQLNQEMASADLIFCYRSAAEESLWNEIEEKAKELNKLIIWSSHDPSFWPISNVSVDIPARCYTYIMQGGDENFRQLFLMLGKRVLKEDLEFKEPKRYPWEGIYHPEAEEIFTSTAAYLSWYGERKPALANKPAVGLLFTRSHWVNDNIEVEKALIAALEKRGLRVIAAFCYSVKDEGIGTKGPGQCVRDYFLQGDKSYIQAMIKMSAFFLERGRDDLNSAAVAGQGVNLLKILNVPVFQPIVSSYKTEEEWLNDPQGLNSDISWSIAMPEFEGVIEPLLIGAVKREGDREKRSPVNERINNLADRVFKWVKLQLKPVAERKVAFIFNNNPCASVEATVGGGANLDTIESVSRIMHKMKAGGYTVNPPENGQELIKTIMDRKAVSEFRWTTVDEIVQKGGVIYQMPKEEYCQWFDKLAPQVKERIIGAWGNPPGEEINGVPPAMVYDGKILITGVEYGNVYVGVQPKRGCAGARCDGQVCKILHDPDIPPPHQYMATYKYLEGKVDVIVHVGTHGNLEFLPGKGTALSGNCYPDLAIGTIPHL